MKCYPEETEDLMRRYYESLNERDCRRYAGMEAHSLPDVWLHTEALNLSDREKEFDNDLMAYLRDGYNLAAQ